MMSWKQGAFRVPKSLCNKIFGLSPNHVQLKFRLFCFDCTQASSSTPKPKRSSSEPKTKNPVQTENQKGWCLSPIQRIAWTGTSHELGRIENFSFSIDIPHSSSASSTQKLGVINRKYENYDVWHLGDGAPSSNEIIGGIKVQSERFDAGDSNPTGVEGIKGITCFVTRRKSKNRGLYIGSFSFFTSPLYWIVLTRFLAAPRSKYILKSHRHCPTAKSIPRRRTKAHRRSQHKIHRGLRILQSHFPIGSLLLVLRRGWTTTTTTMTGMTTLGWT